MSAEDRIAYVLKLTRAVHGYGYDADRLEDVLGATSLRLGLEAQFSSTPTTIVAAFGPQEDQRTFLLRVEPGDTDLGRLADVDSVTLRVARGELSPGQGSVALDGIAARPPLYGKKLTTVAFGVASAAAARFLGGGLGEIALAGGLGIVTGLLWLAKMRWATLARVFEPVAALVATFIATAFAAGVTPVSTSITVLAGLIVLIPGLTLTTAMTELATRHLSSGTARLSGALAIFLTIVFGVAVGGKLGQLVFGNSASAVAASPPGWTVLIALAVAPAAFVVLQRAHLSDLGWITAGGWIAYGAARAGASLFGVELSAFTGAFAVAAAANLYALLRDRPSQIVLVPAILLLVPGSFGFRSVSELLNRDVLTGVETAFTMVFIATGIVAGLLVANVLVPRRREEGRSG